MSKQEFDDSTPVEIACYHNAEVMRRKRADIEHWEMGLYNLSAFTTALAHCIGGKKGKSAEYVKEPFSERFSAKSDADLTEKEIEAERNKLLISLQTMQANFELSHNSGKGDK